MLSSVVLLLLLGLCLGGNIEAASLLQRAASSRCPLGSVQFKSSCYQFSHNMATYAEALSFCRYFNSNLAHIESRYEDDFLRGHLKRHGGGASYSIDGTDLHTEGIWTWEHPVRRISYLNWYPGQPSNGHWIEHCLELHFNFEYRMNDIPCERKNRLVCEQNL